MASGGGVAARLVARRFETVVLLVPDFRVAVVRVLLRGVARRLPAVLVANSSGPVQPRYALATQPGEVSCAPQLIFAGVFAALPAPAVS